MNWQMDIYVENQPYKLCKIIKNNRKEGNKNYLSKSSMEYINLVKNEQFMLSDLYDEFALHKLKIPNNREYFMTGKFFLKDIVFIDKENGIGDIKYFTSLENKVAFHIKNYFKYWEGCCSEWGDYGCCASIQFISS
jgi:hypothetical protein